MINGTLEILGGIYRYIISIIRREDKPFTDFLFTSQSDKSLDEIFEIERQNRKSGLIVLIVIILFTYGVFNIKFNSLE